LIWRRPNLAGAGSLAAEIIKAAYGTMVSSSDKNAAIPARLENKLAYAMHNTQIEVRFFHKNREPPLVTYFLSDDPGEFCFNELGWQDPITVTVNHSLALLPGPGRLLARNVPGPGGSADRVSESIEPAGNVYVYPLSASATVGGEGEKSVIPYVYPIY